MTADLLTYSFYGEENVPPDIRVFISRLMPVFVKMYVIDWGYYKKSALAHFDWNTWGREDLWLPGHEGPRINLERETLGEISVGFDEIEHSYFECHDFQPPHIDHTLNLSIECQSLYAGGSPHLSCEIKLSCDEPIIFEILKARIEKSLSKFAPKKGNEEL